ncbi:MAG: glycosyltransferase family 39 protein [Caldilineaceae bacterium]|nr:glycosyltransferase family 39 protein [Caldilineaceae bacterium]
MPGSGKRSRRGSRRTPRSRRWRCWRPGAGGWCWAWPWPSPPAISRCAACLDEKTAFAATLFLAWSPFYVALSRQLHPDGLVASLSFLALLLFLAWLYAASPDGRRPRRYLVGSGIIMGLAWLTKTPAIFLVPTGLVLMAIEWLRPRTPDAPAPRPSPTCCGAPSPSPLSCCSGPPCGWTRWARSGA